MRKIKRFTVGLLVAVTACLLAVGLTGCTQKGDREGKDVHVCEWEIQSEINASCTSNAKVKMVCKDASCGKTQMQELPGTQLAHQYESDEMLKVPATCTENAYIPAHSCVMCGGKTIPRKEFENTKLYHDGERHVDNKYKKYIDGALNANDLYVDEKTGEKYFNFGDVKSREPNCQEQAYCGYCGMFWGGKLNHSINLVVREEVKPTCTTDGYNQYVECVTLSEITGKQCTYSTFKLLHKTGHDGEAGTEKTDEYGNKYDYFDNELSEQEVKDLQTGKNNFDNLASMLPTCTTAAYCGICNQFYGEYGHKMAAATCDEPTRCTVEDCNFTVGEALGHLFQERDEKLPTCEEKGWGKYLYCTRCKYDTQEVLPELGHDWRSIPAVEATCTEVGREGNGIDCARCHVIQVKPTTINALGHDGQREGQDGVWYVGSSLPDCTHYGYCAICENYYGENITGWHTYVYVPAQSPTCEQEGWYEYEKCIYCNYSTYKDNVIPRLPHTMEYFERVEPTCTKPGREAGWACRYCSLYDLLEIPALGHDGQREGQTGYYEADSYVPDCENYWGFCGICDYWYEHENFTGHEYRGDECIHCGKNRYE